MKVSKEKKERSLGVHLHVKGERCLSPKCAMVRRPYPPGVHGQKKTKRNLSDFGRQLKEKQKFKISYGLDDRSLARIFRNSEKGPGETSIKFLQALEGRLENVVFRLGLSKSRSVAHQLVRHGHIMVNGKKVVSPGYSVRVGDVISVRPESRGKGNFRDLTEYLKEYEVPAWLQLDTNKLEGKVISNPAPEAVPFEVNLLVESFSK